MASTMNISAMEFERIRRVPSKGHDANHSITGKPALGLCLEANNGIPEEYKNFLREFNNNSAKRQKEKGLI